jgi:hypothetical protein
MVGKPEQIVPVGLADVLKGLPSDLARPAVAGKHHPEQLGEDTPGQPSLPSASPLQLAVIGRNEGASSAFTSPETI